jgi:hypothetical protein
MSYVRKYKKRVVKNVNTPKIFYNWKDGTVNFPEIMKREKEYYTFTEEKLVKGVDIYRKYACEDRMALARQIFKYFIELVFEDLIENNIIFTIPVAQGAVILIEEMSVDDIVRRTKSRRQRNVNMVESGFKLCEMIILYNDNDRFQAKRHICLPKALYERIQNKISKGFKYYAHTQIRSTVPEFILKSHTNQKYKLQSDGFHRDAEKLFQEWKEKPQEIMSEN